jgi:hypothetical protein
MFEFIKNCCFQFFFYLNVSESENPWFQFSGKKKIQNQRTINPGYLKNVKETSGFYERTSGLWASI